MFDFHRWIHTEGNRLFQQSNWNYIIYSFNYYNSFKRAHLETWRHLQLPTFHFNIQKSPKYDIGWNICCWGSRGVWSTERRIYQQAMLVLVRRKGDGKLILFDILARLLCVILIYLVHLYRVSQLNSFRLKLIRLVNYKICFSWNMR